MKDWQLGFELEKLTSLSAPFKSDFKPFVFGAFGIPKERDIAIYLKAGELAWTGNPPSAAAVFKLLASGSSHEDFCRRVAHLKAGDLFIKAVAGANIERLKIINRLAEKSKAPAVWVECFAEDKEFVHLLLTAGFAKVMTKIPASSELKLLMLRGATTDRLPFALDEHDVPALKSIRKNALNEGQHKKILSELAAYEKGDAWKQHYSSYNKRQSWTAFSLRGFNPKDPGFIIKPSEMSKKWKEEHSAYLSAPCDWTTAAKHFPETISILEKVMPGESERMRFMALAPNDGELTRHADITDPDAGTKEGKLCRIHIPLLTNPECIFRSWELDGTESRIHFAERQMFYLDTRKPHAVINGGPTRRIHLVVDMFSQEWIRKALCE